MKEEGVADRRLLEVLVDDLRDRDGRLPLTVLMVDAWQRMTVDEGKLTALEEHAAVGSGEPAAAFGAVGDHFSNRELARERLALGFKINTGREAFELVVARIGRAKLRDHRSKIATRPDRRLAVLVRVALGLAVRRLGRGEGGLAL